MFGGLFFIGGGGGFAFFFFTSLTHQLLGSGSNLLWKFHSCGKNLMKSEQYSSSWVRVQDTWKNLSVSRINRRPNSQLSDIKISLSPHEGKQTNPPNKYKVVHFIRRLSGDLHFARSGICFNHSTHRPCFPLFPTPIISKDKPGVYNCKIKTTLTPEYWSLTKNTEQWLKMYHSSWFFMLSQAFVLIFKQLTRNRNALISGLHGQFLAHATSLNCASKKKKKKQQIPLNPCRYWGTAFLFQTLK